MRADGLVGNQSGAYLIDGCTSHSDPWRPARMIFLVAIAAVLSIPFGMTVVG